MSAFSTAAPQKSFVRLHVLPALTVLIIPLFSAWFFSYAEDWQDRQILEELTANVERSDLPAARKAELMAYFRAMPVSRIMASNEPEALRQQETFSPAAGRYALFRWMKRTAWLCLGTVAATLLIVGLSVALSFRSPAAQYRALRIGWPVLRTSAVIQVLGQGVLAVLLSYWVTAVCANVNIIKLIGLVGILVVGAALALISAIFTKTSDRFEVAGELVSDGEAPALWQRVRDMAARLSTAPPDRIAVGIVPNFFVTEHPVILSGEIHHGRTLYLSLPLLKVLAVEEADAILGHEFAHFSGEDTLWSLKVAPLRMRFNLYLQKLANGFSLGVASFMYAFWKLYELSINRLSRAREFRADQLGAGLTSADAAKRALIKITSYCEFRAQTERAILAGENVDEGLRLAHRLEDEYPGFLATFTRETKSIDERVPHPFDSHPTLSNRLEHLGFDARAALQDPALLRPAAGSWHQAIHTAPALEQRLWTQQQEALKSFHEEDLLLRMRGVTEEETAMLQEEFPRVEIAGPVGAHAVVDFDSIQLAGWTAPLPFKEIIQAEVDQSFGRRHLVLTHRKGLISDGTTTRINLKLYPGPPDVLEVFGRYYSRHKIAEVRSHESS